ncbi:Mismatch repair protein msh3 [Stygiomarasmius scandens]|uniref:Mismatch repair protein msh3 n=1 Tax=Marasmiellus scandens TaxID=2682957 RepID=A0ABR1JVR0_9AGAR
MSTSQARLSQYFSSQSSSSPRKRGIDVIDLTDDDPSSKKPKRDVNPKTTQWRFDPQIAIDQVDSSGSESKKARHEAFKKKLLLENNSLFINKPSGTRDSDLVEDERASDSESDRELKKSNKNISYSSEKRRNTATTNARRADIGPSGKSYTPLEKQILRLKEENPGTVLMVEVGYKFKFFGEDAKVAATELGVACYPDRNFLVAFIPCERRHIHLKNLLSRGHRVGIVNQIETAALKKISDNKNAVFERKLTHLFTAATFVDELDSIDDRQSVNPPTFLCIVENTKSSTNEKDVNIALISISPSTGDVVWDDFSDTTTRLELQARLAHMKPSEILSLRGGLTKPTERMLRHVVQSSTETGKVRSETFSTLMSYTDAFSFISNYYTSKASNRSGELMAMISGFSRRVVIAIAHTIKYLSTYNLADALATKFFSKFTSQSHMVLTANTLNNLEIFQNATDGSTRGTLFSLLNLTQTKFGARLLRRWVAQPLIDKDTLQERVDAVEEIISSSSEILVTLRQILRKLPDLARGLCRIQYNQCIPKELAVLFSAFEKIAKPFEPFNEISHVGFRSRLLNEIIFALPTLRPAVKEIIGAIHTAEALKGNKVGLWTDSDKYPKIEETAMALQAVEVDLLDKLKSSKDPIMLLI